MYPVPAAPLPLIIKLLKVSKVPIACRRTSPPFGASGLTYLKCEKKSARIENVEEIFSIGLNRAITLIAEAKPGRISSSLIKDLGEHPEDKKPVRIMKGQYGPYIKYKSLNATIPEEKDPTEINMEEALILIEKRKEYDKSKKSRNKKK